MPKSHGMILYAIYEGSELVYAGITSQTLCERMRQHKYTTLAFSRCKYDKVRVLKTFSNINEAQQAESKMVTSAKLRGLCRLNIKISHPIKVVSIYTAVLRRESLSRFGNLSAIHKINQRFAL
jgi:predicted GIY-YIG superfamily endonuclease